MKRLLLPLIAALALPTAVNAESYWLILTYGLAAHNDTAALEKIEMPNAAACEQEGRGWEQSSTHSGKKTYRRFHCITGK
mgnify:CR=1 FL=1